MNAGYAYVKVDSLSPPHTHTHLRPVLERREHLMFLCDASDSRKSHMTEAQRK